MKLKGAGCFSRERLGNQQKGHPKMSASRIMATFDEKTNVPFEDTMELSEESEKEKPTTFRKLQDWLQSFTYAAELGIYLFL